MDLKSKDKGKPELTGFNTIHGNSGGAPSFDEDPKPPSAVRTQKINRLAGEDERPCEGREQELPERKTAPATPAVPFLRNSLLGLG